MASHQRRVGTHADALPWAAAGPRKAAKRREPVQTRDRREPVLRMVFRRVPEIAGTSADDLRIRRVGVRVPPGVPVKPLHWKGFVALGSQLLRNRFWISGLYLGRTQDPQSLYATTLPSGLRTPNRLSPARRTPSTRRTRLRRADALAILVVDDQSRCAIPGDVAPCPLDHHQESVLKADQKEDVDT